MPFQGNGNSREMKRINRLAAGGSAVGQAFPQEYSDEDKALRNARSCMVGAGLSARRCVQHEDGVH
ncbi:hypothetical protein [Rubritalea tangerina]|uniref:hypothetical protein n=1 Tax=Rubritalea tangerina TaxID=430798 RepID=UPI00360EF82F